MLGWWAEYQFDGVSNIIGGEVEGNVVTALRLFSATNLPQLAQLWCCKDTNWDSSVCEKYMSTLLRFIKMCCSKIPREVLSFELTKNGDVVCIKRNFAIQNRNFEPNQILPIEFIKDLYPPPPPPPKPGKKRGRKPKMNVQKPVPKNPRIPQTEKFPVWRHLENYKHGQDFSSSSTSLPSVTTVYYPHSPHSSDEEQEAQRHTFPLEYHLNKIQEQITTYKKLLDKNQQIINEEKLKAMKKEGRKLKNQGLSLNRTPIRRKNKVRLYGQYNKRPYRWVNQTLPYKWTTNKRTHQ
nr:uncharacterized protein LOC128688816 [Cherax quadricarinatus]